MSWGKIGYGLETKEWAEVGLKTDTYHLKKGKIYSLQLKQKQRYFS